MTKSELIEVTKAAFVRYMGDLYENAAFQCILHTMYMRTLIEAASEEDEDGAVTITMSHSEISELAELMEEMGDYLIECIKNFPEKE